MTQEISLAATSGRVRAPTYDELYGRSPRRSAEVAPAPVASPWRPALIAALIAAIGMAAISQRERIVRRAPAMSNAYAALGMPVNTRGLAFKTVKTTLLDDASQRVLGVEGQISNLRDVAVDVPDMRISISSANGLEIYNWVARSPKSRLGPGEEVYFRTRLNAPPDQGEKVTVRFADLGANQPAKTTKK